MKDSKYSKPDQRYAIYKLDKEVMKKYIEDEDSEDESYVDFSETSEDKDDSINHCLNDLYLENTDDIKISTSRLIKNFIKIRNIKK